MDPDMRALWVIIALTLSGCAATQVPDLINLYAVS